MIRVKIAVFGLLAVAVLSIFNLLLDLPGLKFGDVAAFDRHVSQMRAALPHSGTIGYFTDAPAAETAQEEYYLTQYALAPLVIAKGVDRAFVVANMHNPKAPIADPRLKLLRDYGSGIKLLGNTAK